MLPLTVWALLWAVAPAAQGAVPANLLTRAEASDYRATSSYDETLDLIRRIEERSPYVQLSFFGHSAEGRPLPLVVASKEKAFAPAEARRLPKPIVLLQSAIHAGEVDGKDASLMLLRDLALGRHPEFLDTVTLLIVPIYNVDGHERVSPFHRANQDGPVDGMGFRTTSNGLDLNRDHLKLVSAEARALVALVNAWRPHLHVDNHVSNGFDHAWQLGFHAAEAPQAAAAVHSWLQAHLPAVREATRGAGHPNGPYVELMDDQDPSHGVLSPPYRPRYSTGYFALRNRPSILVETHSHKPFRDRVLANHAFLVALLAEIARDPAGLTKAVAEAERRTIALGAADAAPSAVVLTYGPDRDSLATDPGTADRLRLPIYQWSTEPSVVTGGTLLRYQRGKLRETEVPWWHVPRIDRTVPRPRGYVVLPGWPEIEQRLRAHGLLVETLAAAADVEVETITVSDPVFAKASYQGHTAVTSMKVVRQAATRRVPAGALWVPAAQPDFEVAVHLLEPDAPDSLMAWGLLSTVFERKEWMDAAIRDDLARGMLEDPAIAAQWAEALRDEAFARDTRARELWWDRRTRYWDPTVGVVPVYRVMTAATFTTR